MRKRYTSGGFDPRPDHVVLAEQASWLAESHLAGLLAAPLTESIKGLRAGIRDALRYLQTETKSANRLAAALGLSALEPVPDELCALSDQAGPSVLASAYKSASDYCCALAQDLARMRRQFAECEAARDLLCSRYAGGWRVFARCPTCHDRAPATDLADGRTFILRHDRGSQVCSGAAAIL